MLWGVPLIGDAPDQIGARCDCFLKPGARVKFTGFCEKLGLGQVMLIYDLRSNHLREGSLVSQNGKGGPRGDR